MSCTPSAGAADPAGRVVDASDRPVTGVTVWAIGRNWENPAVTSTATTGPDGRFVLPGAWKLGELDLRYVGILAQAPGGRIGWKGTVWRHEPATSDILIEVAAGVEIAARLVDHEGKPLLDVDVILDVFDRSDPEKGVYDEIVLSEALTKPFQARSDREGRFVLKGVPRGVRLRARVNDPAAGGPSVYWNPEKVSTLTLDHRLGTIRGRLAAADGKDLAGTVKIKLRRQFEPLGSTPQARPEYQVTVTRSLTAAKDGSFSADGLPPGKYSLNLVLPPELPYADGQDQGHVVALSPGKPAEPLEIRLQRLPLVRGRIVDETTGDGISGVELTAYQLKDNSLRYGRGTKTDGDGRYTVAVVPGLTVIHPHGPPKTYLGMYQENCPKIEVREDHAWSDLKLSRAATLDGRVVDPEGKPVAGAEIRLTVPEVNGFASGDQRQVSAADGTFRLERMDPTDKIPVRARTGEATTSGAIVIRPSELDPPGKLTVMIDPKNAARLTGRVVDQRGKPVAGVPVAVLWSRMLVSEKAMKGTGLGSILDQVRTGPDGRFRTQAIWPGDRYHVTVDLKPYAKAETPQAQLSVGETRDVGTISLVESTAALSGIVVDSQGKPIAGAEVFNRGDGPQPVSVRTGPDGRFRLEGLFAGSKFAFARRDGFRHGRLADALRIAGRKYVFVRKEGYQFGGKAVDGEPESLEIRLCKAGEPPRQPAASQPADNLAEKEFATQTLLHLWEHREEYGIKQGSWRLAILMARIDPARSETWAREIGGRLDFFQKAAAEALAESDVAAAIAFLKRAGITDPGLVLSWAERLADRDPKTARRIATDAVGQARQIKKPGERAWTLARAGALLARTGAIDDGKAVVEEACRTVEKLGTENMDGYARGLVAGALARFDAKRALALVEPIKQENERERYLGFIVSGLAPTDPTQVLALVDRLDTASSLPQSLKTEIAYTVAPRDPDQAVRIVEGMTTGHGTEKAQAEAYGWLALAIAPKDRARAFGLIDRGLALPIDKPEPFGSYTYFGGGLASAAGIALNARKLGYPDREGALLRVMAARPDGRHGFNDPAMRAQCQTIASPLVALLDRDAAAIILGQLEARGGLSAADLQNITGEWWLAAWALADLKHAEGLTRAAIESLKDASRRDQALRGIEKMIEVLLTPPDRREEHLRRQIGASWRPHTSIGD